MNRYKKGFTLVELLGVVSLLGIIAVIVTPVVKGIINQSIESAGIKSAQSYIEAADTFYAASKSDEDKMDIVGTNILDELKVTNGHATGSLVLEKDGTTNMAIVIDGKCYAKTRGEDASEVRVSDDVDNCGVTPLYCFASGLNQVNPTSYYEISQYLCDGKHFKTMSVKPGMMDAAAELVFDLWAWGMDQYQRFDTSTNSYYYYELPYGFAYLVFSAPDPWGNYFDPHFFSKELFDKFVNRGGYLTDLCFDYTIDATNVTEVVIPNEIDGHQIEAIQLFNDANLNSVVIPNTVKTLGYYAFTNNNLTSVTLPSHLEMMYDETFKNNKLKSINLPSTLTEISSNAFENNEIEKLVISNTITKINDEAFKNNKIKELTLTPANLTQLGYAVFTNNQLPDDQAWFYYTSYGTKYSNYLGSYGGAKRDNLVIPDSYTTIGEHAVEGCNLTGTLTLPNVSNLSIYDAAFRNNKITHIVYPKSFNSLSEGAFNNNMLPDDEAFIKEYASSTEISSYGGAKKDNVVIPSNFSKIGMYAFEDSGINSVTIPSSITIIPMYAFKNNNLTSIEIPNSVTSIDSGAFENNKLTSFNLPSSITKISSNMFKNNNLSTVTIPNTVTLIDNSAFEHNQIKSVVIPNSVVEISVQAFADNSLDSITIPSSVKTIRYCAFAANNLTSVIIKGKESKSGFTLYGSPIFGWTDGYDDSKIQWNE